MILRICLFLTVILCSHSVATAGSLTLPLTHMTLTPQQTHHYYQQTQHHLRHFAAEDGSETFPLHSLKSIFVLSFTVNGLPYNLSVDTGSSDFLIKGEQLQGSPQRKFSCKKCITENQLVSTGYLDGKLQTYVHNSTIGLGSHQFNQSILVAYECDNIQNFFSIGGIVGLSFQQKGRNPYPNFINTLIKEKIINKYRFGLKLNFIEPQTSFLTLGGIDSSHIDPYSQISYYDIASQTFSYKLKTEKFHFGNKQLDLGMGLLDSGNTCVSIDDSFTEDMLEVLNVGGNQCQFTVEKGNNLFKLLVCTIKDFDALPVLTLEMPDGKKFSYEKEYYIDTCTSIESDDDEPLYKCNTYIENVKHRSYGLLLGAAWMLKYYTVFDLDDKKIGMAKNTDNPSLSTKIAKAAKNAETLARKNINVEDVDWSANNAQYFD